ncbi:antibiotic biosynthesis monooxygenase [Sphaerisporangium sp. NPDC051017]|uniref:antibiotic biosynthesis monooxygenase n=1 Tax=Sphaerisporangium sp. NPDC051017 TaxID=3154636 RepID=UPI003442CEF9
MEAVVAVTAFAGAVFAAITTGILVGRLREQRTGWLLAWAITTASLCLALSSVAIGHLIGFGPATFRVYQITGAFLAPFWLAIGMVQLLARGTAGKFAAWLFGAALTLVTLVILAVDPISATEKLSSKVLPLGDTHWTIIPTALLTAAHAATYLILIGCLILAVLRWRGGDDSDADNMHAGVVLTPTGFAIVGAVRFAIPGVFAALLITLMVGAVWYAVARPLAPYDEERDDTDDVWEEEQRPSRRRAPEPSGTSPESGPMPVAAPAMPPPRRSGLGDLVAEYRAGDPGEVDFAARMQPSGGSEGQFEGHGGPRTGEFMEPGPPPGRLNQPGRYQGPQGEQPPYGQQSPYGRPEQPGQQQEQFGRHGGYDATVEAGFPGPNGPNGSHRAPGQPEFSMPATGVLFSGAEAQQAFGRPDPPAAPEGLGGRGARGVASAPAGGSAKPSTSIYGLLTVFTLMDGAGEAFDRLADETVEAVRRSEPDTLIFICHAVKSAPLQRIVYEIYRDEVAFTEHQRQAHMERFARERVAHVLAANVIELNVNAAKVVPLPTAYRV